MSDDLTSFSTATFVSDMSADELKKGLLLCCHPLDINQSTMKVDCTPMLPKCDSLLTEHNIILEVRCLNSLDKNSIANRATKELEFELTKIYPSGNPVSAVSLLRTV